MKVLFLALVMAASSVVAPASMKAAPAATADKVLIIEVVVPAPIGEVWKAFTTSAGLSTWLTPNAVVDLREGWGVDCSFSGRQYGRRDNSQLCAGERVGAVGAGTG